MKKRVAKFIVSITAALTLAVGFSISASADVLGGAGLLGSALGSLGIDLLAGGSAGIAAIAPWLNGDFSIVGALTGVADGYIKVGDDTVIIDGVEYESIFLDPSMAAELHTQAFDFASQHAITSNSSGLLATGWGYWHGIPLYSVNGSVQSQNFGVAFGTSNTSWISQGIGDFIVDLWSQYPNGTAAQGRAYLSGQTVPGFYSVSKIAGSMSAELYVTHNTINNRSYLTFVSPAQGNLFNDYLATENAFNFSYVAGNIDSTPLPQNYGFYSFVPTQTLANAGFTTGTYVIDGGTGTDEVRELIELLDDIYSNQQMVDSEFAEAIVPPVPPQPIDTPLGEIPYEDFLDTFGQSVYGKLDAISDGIDTVGRVIDGAGTDVIEAVDTAGQSVVDGLSDVEGAIDTAGQSVVDSVEESTGILEEAIEAVEAKVDELVDSIAEVIEEIMTHPLDLFSAWLDRLPEIPAIKDIFDGIKRHVGIWHYVVEWLSCIGTFLAFFIGLFGDVAYCMVVPIYACVAGAICLAFYKRFAR